MAAKRRGLQSMPLGPRLSAIFKTRQPTEWQQRAVFSPTDEPSVWEPAFNQERRLGTRSEATGSEARKHSLDKLTDLSRSFVYRLSTTYRMHAKNNNNNKNNNETKKRAIWIIIEDLIDLSNGDCS